MGILTGLKRPSVSYDSVSEPCLVRCMLAVLSEKSGSGSQLPWDGHEKVPWITKMAKKDRKGLNPIL